MASNEVTDKQSESCRINNEYVKQTVLQIKEESEEEKNNFDVSLIH